MRRLAIVALTLGAGLLAAGPAGAQSYAGRAGAQTYAGPAGVQSSVSAPTKGALYTDGPTGRYLLGGTWLYRADPLDLGVQQGFWQNVAASTGWSPVTIPNAENAGDFSAASHAGTVGWYRRDFTLPAGAFPRYVPRADRRWIVRFERINFGATVWLNGVQIGSHSGEFFPFELPLTGLRRGVNRLVVRVDNRRTAGELPPGPGSGWWNFGGLIGEVYLRAVARADVSLVVVRPELSCPRCDATIFEQVVVRNPTRAVQRVQLTGRYGPLALDFGSARIRPGARWMASASAVLAHPRLWSIDHPALYHARLTLSDVRGRPLQGYTVLSGVRSIAVASGGQLELNGRVLHLRGVELIEQTLRSGSALGVGAMRQIMARVRALGATVIRTYPLSEQLQELADRDGVLIWSEIPAVQLTADNYLTQPAWLAEVKTELGENIQLGENHPSVMLWSVGNELPTPATPEEGSYLAWARAVVRRLDPTRPVGLAISDWPGVPCQPAWARVDVIGFNDYFGWFDAGGGTTDDRDQLSPFLDSLRACFPHKALFVSEFGFDANRSGPIEERGTYQFQADSAAFHLGVFASKPWLSGAIYFILQDAAAYPSFGGGNPWPSPPFNTKGLLDLNGNPKPAFGVVQASYRATRQIGP